jgi:hypothetical protein
MAQAVLVVCDVCGAPAVETASIKVGARGYQKDLCQKHLGELLTGSRTPRRGRPRTKTASPAPRKTGKRAASTTAKGRKPGRSRKKGA